MNNFQLVDADKAWEPLGFNNKYQLYTAIREGQLPNGSVIRFGKRIRINMAAVAEAMKLQNTAVQKAAA